ncbi:hypothetical protein G7054_g8942 [Neopestalotiopsis clavispora]|nr:hypothetical protein G7054_g8942 [Neopestalotiopsis clavispora]
MDGDSPHAVTDWHRDDHGAQHDEPYETNNAASPPLTSLERPREGFVVSYGNVTQDNDRNDESPRIGEFFTPLRQWFSASTDGRRTTPDTHGLDNADHLQVNVLKGRFSGAAASARQAVAFSKFQVQSKLQDLSQRKAYDDTMHGRLCFEIHQAIKRNKSDDNKVGFISVEKVREILNITALEEGLAEWDSKLAKLELPDLRYPFPPNANAGRETAIRLEAQRILGITNEQLSIEHTENRPEAGILPIEKTYIKILAILIRIERPARIKLFTDADICDRDLPLFRVSKDTGGKSELCGLRKKDSNQPLQAFGNWSQSLIDRFEETQWYFLANVFGPAGRKSVPHYEFGSKDILPFKFSNKNGTMRGGSGQIRKVKIHPHHRAFKHYDVRHLLVHIRGVVSAANKELGVDRNTR